MTAARVVSPGPWDTLFTRRTLGVRMGLEVVEGVFEAMGSPGRGIPTVHIVGTNGKGSTAALIEHALRAQGMRTGMYTSPHLQRVGERVRVDGQITDEDELREQVAAVLRAEQGLMLPRPLSFFELVTVAALRRMAAARVDVMIVEAGVGGRLDATRLVTPSVVAVSSIDLDHQGILGDTIAAITTEKAAVMQSGVPTVSAPQRSEAAAVLQARSLAVGCSLHVVEPLSRAPLGMPGAHQRINGALALAAARVLVPDLGPEALDGARWPGRLECLAWGGGTLVLDVAHNPAGAATVAAAVLAGDVPRPTHVVIGCQGDKDGAGMMAALAAVPGQRWWVALGEVAPPPAEPPAAWTHGFDDPQDPALHAALVAALAQGAVVLVLGSHLLVGAVRARALGDERPADPQDPRAIP